MPREIRTIVVGVGMTPEQDPVLVPALRLAGELGATLHVVHGYDLPEPMIAAYARMGYMKPELSSHHGEEICQRLEAQVEASGGGDAVKCHARYGSAGQILSEMAARIGADLLIVGATRQGALSRYFLGSTADAVVRSASVPVLVLRQAFEHPLQRVLLTTDLSRFSGGVFEQGIEVVEALPGGAGAQLRSLLVLPYDPVVPPPLSRESLDEFMRGHMRKFIEERAPRSREIVARMRVGEAAMEVVEEAREWNADLVVVGTHGRVGISRLMLGSVASAILRDVPCNVLVIPAARVEESEPGAATEESLASEAA